MRATLLSFAIPSTPADALFRLSWDTSRIARSLPSFENIELNLSHFS
jgi:hypothetical protein